MDEFLSNSDKKAIKKLIKQEENLATKTEPLVDKEKIENEMEQKKVSKRIGLSIGFPQFRNIFEKLQKYGDLDIEDAETIRHFQNKINNKEWLDIYELTTANSIYQAYYFAVDEAIKTEKFTR